MNIKYGVHNTLFICIQYISYIHISTLASSRVLLGVHVLYRLGECVTRVTSQDSIPIPNRVPRGPRYDSTHD